MTTDGAQLQECDTLPHELAACHALIQVQREQLDTAVRKIRQMEHQLQQLLRRLYGRSSEKIDPKQMALFAEMLKELESQNPPTQPLTEEPHVPKGRTTGHGRRRIPDDLPRERVIHDLPDDEKPCPCCGTMRTLIGQETSEQLDYVPAKLKVIEHVRLKYICKDCEAKTAEGGPQIATAEKPLSPIEKGLAAPGLLAHVIVSKYTDHLPLHRLEKIFRRHDIRIARSTMCDWMRQSAEALAPLYETMIKDTLASRVIHTDDTPVEVQDPKLGKTRTGRFWVYVGDESHPQVVFDYTPNRKRDGPMMFLNDWGNDEKRFLQADAFGGYDGIYAGDAGGNVVEVACWSHARRKFFEAQKTDHRNSAQAMAYIKHLYEVESDAREPFAAQPKDADGNVARSLAEIRLMLRRERSAPILADFKTWLVGLQTGNAGDDGVARQNPVLPKSPMGQAITYAMNQWDALNVYTTDGELNIDNNAAENALRRIAVGRKNWLFAGSDNGGRTAAILFSLLATCQRHDVEPFAYTRDVLTRIAAHPASQLADLLPNHWKPQQ
jgi:transposase